MRADNDWMLSAECVTFAEAATAAKREAQRYDHEVVVVRSETTASWQVFVAWPAIERYDRRKREEEFEKSCQPDPTYESEDAPDELRPVWGNDWSLLD